MRLLVTGGAGFIGSHLVEAMIADGHDVTVIDDLSSGRRENLPADARLEVHDITSAEAARVAQEGGFATVFHLAAQMDVRRSTADPVFDARVNVLGLLNVVDAAARGGARQVVFASSGGAIYGAQTAHPADETHPTRPVSPYGVSKLAGERYLDYYHLEKGLDVACLRYANVYGERQNPHGEAGVVAIFLDRLLSGEPCTINGDGLQTRDYVHVSDVVRANMACLGLPGFRIYNVGTGVETTVVELYRRLAEATGRPAEPHHGPAKGGEQRRSSVDPARLLSELGLPAPVPLEAGLDRTSEWFRDRRSPGPHAG